MPDRSASGAQHPRSARRARPTESSPPRKGWSPEGPASARLLLGVIAVLALGVAHIYYLRFVCDDAFISYRYAANLAHGRGLVFNPGERVEGYTNFLWVVLCSALIRLGVPPEAGAIWLSGAAALATVAAGMAHLRRRGTGAI